MPVTHVCNKEREIGAILKSLEIITPIVTEMQNEVQEVRLELTGISAKMEYNFDTKMEKIEQIIVRQDIANNRVSKLERYTEGLQPEHHDIIKEVEKLEAFKTNLEPEHRQILKVVDDYLKFKETLIPEHQQIQRNQKLVEWTRDHPVQTVVYAVLFVWAVVSVMAFIDIKTIVALIK
jgi:predicted AlkP superfamily phosphohydrolase/phosphomutase